MIIWTVKRTDINYTSYVLQFDLSTTSNFYSLAILPFNVITHLAHLLASLLLHQLPFSSTIHFLPACPLTVAWVAMNKERPIFLCSSKIPRGFSLNCCNINFTQKTNPMRHSTVSYLGAKFYTQHE